jgi:hypothetical protein
MKNSITKFDNYNENYDESEFLILDNLFSTSNNKSEYEMLADLFNDDESKEKVILNEFDSNSSYKSK